MIDLIVSFLCLFNLPLKSLKAFTNIRRYEENAKKHTKANIEENTVNFFYVDI